MKSSNPPADPQSTQQIDVVDLDDVDVSAEPLSSHAPPKMPPLPALPPLPPAAAAPSRSPVFYVGILVGVLVVSAAIGTVVALSRRKAAPTTTSGPAAPKVITIGTVEMDDNPDAGP